MKLLSLLSFVKAVLSIPPTDLNKIGLTAHNKYRALHQDTESLSYQSNLCGGAREHAEHMARSGKFAHAKDLEDGENLYMSWSSGEIESDQIESHYKKAVEMWYNEIADWDFETSNKKKGSEKKMTGHFTQVVWRGSSYLCMEHGIGQKNGGNAIYVVARYSKPGNYLGQYADNVARLISDKTGSEENETSEKSEKSEESQNENGNSKEVKEPLSLPKAGLLAHNRFRALHEDTPDLNLDQKLCEGAQVHADKMAERGGLRHADDLIYGENLFMTVSSQEFTSETDYTKIYENAVKMWYKEVDDWDFETSSKKKGSEKKMTGHFTQVVWKETTNFCMVHALGKHERGYALYIVAHYSPAGNYVGQYVDNVRRLKPKKLDKKPVEKPVKPEKPDKSVEPVAKEENNRENGNEVRQLNLSKDVGLRLHNSLRLRHKDTPELLHGQELCERAKKHADWMAEWADLIDLKDENLGANLFMDIRKESFAPDEIAEFYEKAVKEWHDENKKWDFETSKNKGHFVPGIAEPFYYDPSETRQFTQLVWKKTTHMCMAHATDKITGRGFGIFIVALYSPPGNIEGQYSENVAPFKISEDEDESAKSEIKLPETKNTEEQKESFKLIVSFVMKMIHEDCYFDTINNNCISITESFMEELFRSDEQIKSLNPFGGKTEVKLSIEVNSRKRRDVSKPTATAKISITYLAQDSTDRTTVESLDTSLFADSVLKSIKSLDGLDVYADPTQPIEVQVKKSGLFVNPDDLTCSGDETFDLSEVTCKPDKFELSIPLCVFKTNNLEKRIDDGIFISGDDKPTTCHGQRYKDQVKYYPAEKDCRLRRENNGTHILNHSALVYRRGIKTHQAITRSSFVKVNFACVAPISIDVGLGKKSIDTQITNIRGALDFENMEVTIRMGLFETDAFTTQPQVVPTFEVEEPMFLGITLENPGELEFRLRKCWATPTEDKNDVLQYKFIEDYCPDKNDVENDYLQLYGGKAQWGIRLASFKFASNQCAGIYVHCSVTLCYGKECDDLICQRSNTRKRKRRTTDNLEETTLNSGSLTVCE